MLLDNTSYTISASDGINLFVRDHSVKNSNKVILLIHGLGEHSGRYLNLIKDFNDKNISVFTIDIRGHGKSEGKSGYFDNFESLVDDAEKIFNLRKTNLPKYSYNARQKIIKICTYPFFFFSN